MGAEFAGPAAYTSLERCLASIGREEQLFNEYARREEVTGLTPFNIVNYCAWTFPEHDIPLDWPDLTTPGPKPTVIPAHTLVLNNGLAAGDPRFRPNPSYAAVQASFRPVAVIANEYDTAFFGGESLRRSVCLYNDTERAADVRLVYRLVAAGGAVICHGERSARQLPGEKLEWEFVLPLPAVEAPFQSSVVPNPQSNLSILSGARRVFRRAQSKDAAPITRSGFLRLRPAQTTGRTPLRMPPLLVVVGVSPQSRSSWRSITTSRLV